MEEIICPKCGAHITVSENDYQALLDHVRNKEFDKIINDKKEQLKKENELNLQIKINEEKQRENKELQALNDKINEITNKLSTAESDKKLAVSEANSIKDKVIQDLNLKIQDLVSAHKLENEQTNSIFNSKINDIAAKLSNAEADKKLAVSEANSAKEKEIQELKLKIEELKNSYSQENDKVKNSFKEELFNKDKEIQDLKNSIGLKEKEKDLEIERLRKENDDKLNAKQIEVDFYKDLKVKLSTKGIGEDLEKYCKDKFDSDIRPFLLQSGNKIHFEKDNDVIDGQKGDFVYREETPEGAELLSIMFEMKNESETTERKHLNSEFFNKLNKDRLNKNCEYAVLVSLLEIDNEQYNNGITTVYEYENMYVIRPNSLGALINLLRNNALKNTKIKNELVLAQRENVDVTNFEKDLLDFQIAFSKNYESSETHFKAAIEKIDSTIKSLEKVKDELQTSGNQLRLANNKAQDLSIKKLTKNNPTMKEKFDSVNKEA